MPTYQTITVDITPGAEKKPVLNASQFDNGRPFNVALTWGLAAFTNASDFRIEMHVKKPDGNIVTADPDSVVNEVCSFLTTEQMCACHGINECEIVLYDNDNLQIGTGNFILDVEKAPDEGGIQSASEIANLETQIRSVASSVVVPIIEDEAPAIIQEEIANIGGRWVSKNVLWGDTQTTITLPKFNDMSVIENIYANEDINITDYTLVGFNDEFGYLKVEFDAAETDLTLYVHYYNPDI